MKEWTVKFVTDKHVEQETVVTALDYTKAYLETLFKIPMEYSIVDVSPKEESHDTAREV